jgi:hypothetical protein
MAGTSLTKAIRRRLYSFAARIAKPFSDSRRRRFLIDMLTGLVAAGHVHLTAIARGVTRGIGNIHAFEKRLSGHLSSEHWDMSPVADSLVKQSAAMVQDDTLIPADLTDLSKPYARHLEGLGRVHDGSDPQGRITPGYAVFEAYARVGKWQLFPLVVEPLKVYAGAPVGENEEILVHIRRVQDATGGRGTWVFDRGFDRRELFTPLVRAHVAFIVRQRGDRLIQAADGRVLSVQEFADEQACPRPRCWRKNGVAIVREVWLPEVGPEPFLLVIGWRVPNSARPVILLISPDARRPGRTAMWFVRAYHRRWGVEDATRGLKQKFTLEQFLVRSWCAIRRLLWLVAWAFWWLNLWGEERFDGLQRALMNHSWRLKKKVTYLFDWIASMLRELLHPHPRITSNTG